MVQYGAICGQLCIIRSMWCMDARWALFDPWFMQVGLKVVWSDMVHVLFWRATPSKWVGSKTYSKFEWPHQCWHVKYAHFFTGWATKVHSKIWVPVFGIKYELNTCSNMCLDVNTADCGFGVCLNLYATWSKYVLGRKHCRSDQKGVEIPICDHWNGVYLGWYLGMVVY